MILVYLLVCAAGWLLLAAAINVGKVLPNKSNYSWTAAEQWTVYIGIVGTVAGVAGLILVLIEAFTIYGWSLS